MVSVHAAGCVDDVLGGCGFINGVQVSVNDDNSHGTHVAGTIGATKNGAGVLGVAQKVSLMSCKFLDANGNGYNSDAIACINYCAANFKRMGQKVPIYSNSWGCLNCYDPTVYNAIANTNGLPLIGPFPSCTADCLLMHSNSSSEYLQLACYICMVEQSCQGWLKYARERNLLLML